MTELIAGDRCLLFARVHLRAAMCCMARAETSSPMDITRLFGICALAFAYRSAYIVPTIFHLNVNTHNWVNAMKSCKFIQDYVSVTNRCWIHWYAFHRFIVLVIFQINIYIIYRARERQSASGWARGHYRNYRTNNIFPSPSFVHFLINEQTNERTHRTNDDPLELCEIVNKWSTEKK